MSFICFTDRSYMRIRALIKGDDTSYINLLDGGSKLPGNVYTVLKVHNETCVSLIVIRHIDS